MRRSMNEYPIIMDKNPRSPIAESYRTLRTGIEYLASSQKLKTIMITSAKPREGKSTTAANLAISFAQIHKKVLLLDADLRKPSLHRVFNKPNRGGLSNILVNQYELQDVVRETYLNDLYLLTSGRIPYNPSELLASDRMSALLDEASDKFDYIILDTSPVLGLSDAQILSAKCDGVFLVIQGGVTKRSSLLKAKYHLEKVQANLLGTILNNIKQRKNADFAYEYFDVEEPDLDYEYKM